MKKEEAHPQSSITSHRGYISILIIESIMIDHFKRE